MKRFFNPDTVAVIGVSQRPDNLGRQIAANLLTFEFKGIIYEVGPRGGSLFGSRIYRSVSDIPDHVDLAVILTPAPTVPEIMAECGRKGIRRVVIESAGFGEYGDEGRRLEERIAEIAEEHGIRFIGPNCIGLINHHNGLALPFVGLDPDMRKGGISIITQSGGVGISILNVLTSEGLGLAKFASIGNKLDVDENDLLAYYIEDPETEIICIYLEGIRDGRRLIELARRATKPILLHKSNIGAAASRIASSHTAALSADDAVVDAALVQAGIARFRDPETLVHYLKALPMPPLRGNRLAVLSRSGGHAVIAADECDLTGFQLAEFPGGFLQEVQAHTRAKVIRLTNPVDLGDLFDLEFYATLAERAIAMDGVDGMVFLHTYIAGSEGEKSLQLFKRLHELAGKYNKPLAIHAATEESELSRLKHKLDCPIFAEPSDAVRSLALLRDFRHGVVRSQRRPDGRTDADAVRSIFDRCKGDGRDPLIQEAMDVLRAYGVPVLAQRLVHDEESAVEAARNLGYPVVMKVVSRDVSHKTDFGGVQLNLRNDEGVRLAYRDMMASIERKAPGARIEGALIQPMVRGGHDLIVGARLDASFGHVVLAGMGGIFVEVFRDTAIRVAPFERDTAEAMLRELKIYPILKGVRGQEPADTETLTEVVLAVVRLITDFPEIVEMDINPIRVLDRKRGCFALDARICIKAGGPLTRGSRPVPG
jgi:acetyltransferase